MSFAGMICTTLRDKINISSKLINTYNASVKLLQRKLTCGCDLGFSLGLGLSFNRSSLIIGSATGSCLPSSVTIGTGP